MCLLAVTEGPAVVSPCPSDGRCPFQLLEPEYYHRPISTTRHDLLSGCVLGISSYSGRERQYLALLGESMGAE